MNHSSYVLRGTYCVAQSLFYFSTEDKRKVPNKLAKLREAPLNLASPLFGHCPNSDYPPPPVFSKFPHFPVFLLQTFHRMATQRLECGIFQKNPVSARLVEPAGHGYQIVAGTMTLAFSLLCCSWGSLLELKQGI